MGEIRTLISEKYKLKSPHFSTSLRNKTRKPLSSGRQVSQIQLYDKNEQPRGAQEEGDASNKASHDENDIKRSFLFSNETNTSLSLDDIRL